MDLVVLFIIVTLGVIARANVIIIRPELILPGKRFILDPSDFDYPNQEVNLLWMFSQDIEIKVKKFEVDGQGSDFLLLSKHNFPSTNEPDIGYDEFKQRLPLDETILMSWNAEEDQLIRLVGREGVFIYFHGEAHNRVPNLRLELEIRAFQRKLEEPTTTTEPPLIVPPGQQPDDYATKFVTGKIPNQFLAELDNFKSILADMTNKYCQEKGIQRPIPAFLTDVHIPLDEIRFCDRAWPAYKECVEVTFAIVTYDFEGYYVMTKSRIDEMWEMYSSDLGMSGYSSYDPPKGARRTVGWLWVVGCLGSVLLISILLCLAWLKKASDELNKDAEISKAMAQVTDEEKFYDRGNPVHQIRKTMVNGRLAKEEEYHQQENQFHEFSDKSFLPSFNGPNDASEIYRVNQMYIPDDDEEEEEYFRKPKPDPSAWHEHVQSSPLHHLRQADFPFEENDED